MNYIRKRCGHGFVGSYAKPYGGKKERKPKTINYQVYGAKKTKYFKGGSASQQDKSANSGAYVV